METRSSTKTTALIFMIISTVTGSAVLWSQSDALKSTQVAQIENRAQRIFAYDRDHPKRLSFNQLAALSVAIKFHDYPGAEKLVNYLERVIAHKT